MERKVRKFHGKKGRKGKKEREGKNQTERELALTCANSAAVKISI
jgi:hypothetical protein